MGKSYGWGETRKDVLAGLTVAAIAVPQAMAYALIAGVDPRFGLYSAIVVTAVASAFGSSAHLINGPTNAISLAVFGALAGFDPDARTEVYEAMFLLGLMVGLVQITIALLKLGDLTRYISESVVIGFMAGAGFLIALTQVGNLLGVSDRGTGQHHLLVRLWMTLTSGQSVSYPTLGIGLLTVGLVVGFRRAASRYHLPRVDMLLALVIASVLATLAGWTVPAEGGVPAVAVVGHVPAGLPTFHLPELNLSRAHRMSGSALAIATLGLLEALAIAKSIATITNQPLDFNRQCLAEGLGNIAGGLFRCLPGSGSLTRSAINFQSGGVSRWSGLIAAAAVGLVMVWLAPLARYVPKPALAGLLLVTAATLLEPKRLLYALRASRYDAWLVLATAFTAVFISIEYSILVGTGLSILLYVPRAARLHATELVVSPERVIRERRPGDLICTWVVLFDLEGEMFFGAAPELERHLEDLTRRAEAGVRYIVMRLKRTRNPDVVCMERLERFLHDMDRRNVTVFLCGIREDFDRAMRNLRFNRWLPADRVFREEDAQFSSTLAAVRRVYELLGADTCVNCPRAKKADQETLYYMI